MKYTVSEELAIHRTSLANERTFLAYFRSFIVILSSALAIIKLEIFERLVVLGYILLVIAPILLIAGIFRYYYVKSRLKKYLQTNSK